MSIQYVSDDLINFLMAAAMNCGRRLGSGGQTHFSWTRTSGALEDLAPDSVQRTGRMLREENVKSVQHQMERGYQGAEPPETAFGTTNLVPIGQPKLAEILKATDYYEYQTSQHPGWWESDAKEFITCLRQVAWMSTPEYRRTAWGEPPHVRSYFRATPEPGEPVQTNSPTDRSRVVGLEQMDNPQKGR